MGLFAKVAETAKPGNTLSGPVCPERYSSDSSKAGHLDHATRGGLFVRARVYADQTAQDREQSSEPSADEVIYDACHDRLERVSPGDCDTALSILKTFYPHETILFIHGPIENPRIYASSGIEMGGVIIQKLENELTPVLTTLKAPYPASVPVQLLPQALSRQKLQPFFLLPVADGSKAWALLSQTVETEPPDEVLGLLTGSLADRFLPLSAIHSASRTMKPSSTAGPATTDTSALFADEDETRDALIIEELGNAETLAVRAASALPTEIRCKALGDSILVLSVPSNLDAELIWHQLLRSALSDSSAHDGRVSLLTAINSAALTRAFGERGYGNSLR